jgi:hypothetical protein
LWRAIRVIAENITVWKKNGVEYLYPKRLVARIFKCSVDELANHNLEDDPIGINGITRTKKELAAEVCELISVDDDLHPEVKVLIDRLKVACK